MASFPHIPGVVVGLAAGLVVTLALPGAASAQTCQITSGPTGWVVDRHIGAVSVFGDLRVRFNGYSEHDGIFVDLKAPGFSHQALIEKGQVGRYTICGMEVTVTAIWAYGAVEPDVRVSAF